MKNLVVIFISLLLLSSNVHARWDTNVVEAIKPKQSIMVGMIGNSYVAFDCHGKTLFFSYFEKVKKNPHNYSIVNKKGTVLLQVDDGEVRQAQGIWRVRDGQSIQLKIEDKKFIIESFNDLMTSRKKFSITIRAQEREIFLTDSIQGSAKAAHQLINECPALEFDL